MTSKYSALEEGTDGGAGAVGAATGAAMHHGHYHDSSPPSLLGVDSTVDTIDVEGGGVTSLNGQQHADSPSAPSPQNGAEPERLLAMAAAEFLGTLFLVFFVCLNGTVMSRVRTSLGTAIISEGFAGGLSIMMLVYSLGPVSGGHFNPVVSLTALVFYRMRARNFLLYIAMQFLGGIVGTGLILTLIPDGAGEASGTLGSVHVDPDLSPWNGFASELISTFFLMFVILNVAWRPHPKIVSAGLELTGVYSGMVIGFCVVLAIMCTVPVSGGCLNPARYLGPALLTGRWSEAWVYLLSEPVGGLLAGLLHASLFAYNRPKPNLGV